MGQGYGTESAVPVTPAATITAYVAVGAFAGGVLAFMLTLLCGTKEWRERWALVFFICSATFCIVAFIQRVWN